MEAHLFANSLESPGATPPFVALLVSGGRLSEKSVPRIERFIEENLKGKKNFHKILVIEAEGSGSTKESKAKVEMKPLTDAQQQDADQQKQTKKKSNRKKKTRM